MNPGWMLVDEGGGAVVGLPKGESIAGRSEDASIHLTDASVSRRHARLQVSETEVWIEDLGSSNGSSVNGLPLSGRVQLRQGDEIRLGNMIFRLEQGMAPLPAPPVKKAVARATQAISVPALSGAKADVGKKDFGPPEGSAGAERDAKTGLQVLAFFVGLLAGLALLAGWMMR